MRVLIACEESQIVCKAFRARGHEAYSCDILPTSGDRPEWHIRGDVLNLLGSIPSKYPRSTQQVPSKYPASWDLMIAHPPCTYLANSGVCHLYNKDKTINQERWQKMKDAARFFQHLWLCDIPKICIENPIMHRYGKQEAGIAFCYDTPEFKQIIQPWMFGHPEQKATCLWLQNLPKLIPTNNIREEMLKLPANKRQRLHYLPPSETRQRERSVTFTGIAEAMANQWG